MNDAVAIILGCGYLGRRLAPLLVPRYQRVWLTNRGPGARRNPSLAASCRWITLDLMASETSSLPEMSDTEQLVDLFCLLPPTALETSPARARLRAFLAHLPIRRAIITSSTGVYGANLGAVSAESPIHPDSARSELLATIERDWQVDSRYRILRLAGLYGPERVIGAGSLQRREALPGSEADYLNLIQADDAAALLLKCVGSAAAARIELGSDGRPVVRGDYFEFVAKLLKAPSPVFNGEARKHGANRRCDPSSTMARTDWRPLYPSYREGIKAALGIVSEE